jgi:TRAP-type uncharacterized transport system substrate-binding protein
MSGGRKIRPRVERYFWRSLKDETSALLSFIRYQGYIIFICMALAAAIIFAIQPTPPHRIRVASGQANSTLENTTKEYANYFRKQSIEIILIPSHGALDNLRLLEKGEVDAAFSQGGIKSESQEKTYSLGSIGYQPLWFFHKGEQKENDFSFNLLKGKKISIGLPGSGTRAVVDDILKIIPPPILSQFKFVELNAEDSIEAIKSGKIDGMFLVADLQSNNLIKLLRMPDVHPLNFPLAEALARHLDYVEVVRLPQGAIQPAEMLPDRPIEMIATTTTILVRTDLHPTIQSLFMDTTSKIQETHVNFFAPSFNRTTGFPAFIDKGMARSPIAERFIQDGPPLFDRFLPFWLASFIDYTWFWILSFFAILIPFMRIIPGYRTKMFSVVASDFYERIFDLYHQLDTVKTEEDFVSIIEISKTLEDEILHLWVPNGNKIPYGLLLAAFRDLQEKIAAMQTKFPSLSIENYEIHPPFPLPE